ncbi:MAG: hypothetical protein A3C02_02685 [Candidatus Andersenbacteria bacterium RIFCSPHIGHO2_02_FULL_45_11]|uniref:Uncharacterized protein n=1 Tax=Candidatus Andersenbacteria bacterium RIFCSPHIGHO2_12_FULL_45_11 TaxID=1797281 RepID=A0A1G1WZW1_9BACT|nr:MAG: hypothetical protein A3C02_02685 [Candidatus Andersenbacteria bacterium RIFCSPHIGHO2_02_FULL_45_11]OGY33285.1 MAG: hypothetical protein A3D99_03075 [Candidatus Andersenbacteria bacterium RIFCSPHIGHO2_12_FULL_45_11]
MSDDRPGLLFELSDDGFKASWKFVVLVLGIVAAISYGIYLEHVEKMAQIHATAPSTQPPSK